MNPNFLAVDLKTASTMSSLSRRSLEKYIRSNRLRARKIGRRTVILVSDLEAFLRSGDVTVIQSTGEQVQ